MKDSVPHITVCVCTFRRAALLPALVDALNAQETGSEFTVSIRIVDNDPECSARETVEHCGRASAFPVEYLSETIQNISRARNRALAGISGGLVALIDDDELPGREWLKHLHRVLVASSADGVLGPVRPTFPAGCPVWLEKSGLCARPEYPTGHELLFSQARTGNVLMKASIFAHDPAPFDERYGLSGGEDTYFFLRQTKAGHRFVWCNEAPAHERVPEDRWTLSYYVRRQFRGGALDGERDRLGGPFLRSAAIAAVHLVRFLLLLPLGRSRYARPLVSMASRWGYFVAAIGYRFRRHRDEATSSLAPDVTAAASTGSEVR